MLFYFYLWNHLELYAISFLTTILIYIISIESWSYEWLPDSDINIICPHLVYFILLIFVIIIILEWLLQAFLIIHVIWHDNHNYIPSIMVTIDWHQYYHEYCISYIYMMHRRQCYKLAQEKCLKRCWWYLRFS